MKFPKVYATVMLFLLSSAQCFAQFRTLEDVQTLFNDLGTTATELDAQMEERALDFQEYTEGLDDTWDANINLLTPSEQNVAQSKRNSFDSDAAYAEGLKTDWVNDSYCSFLEIIADASDLVSAAEIDPTEANINTAWNFLDGTVDLALFGLNQEALSVMHAFNEAEETGDELVDYLLQKAND